MDLILVNFVPFDRMCVSSLKTDLFHPANYRHFAYIQVMKLCFNLGSNMLELGKLKVFFVLSKKRFELCICITIPSNLIWLGLLPQWQIRRNIKAPKVHSRNFLLLCSFQLIRFSERSVHTEARPFLNYKAQIELNTTV